MYRHADSICWLHSSIKKLKVQVIGLEFFDLKCEKAEQIEPNKSATKKTKAITTTKSTTKSKF